MSETTETEFRRDLPADVEVEIWGPPGSGKTVLLLSLYETFNHQRELNDFTLSDDLLSIRARLIEAQGMAMTIEVTRPTPTSEERRVLGNLTGEQMSVTLGGGRGEGPGRRVRIVSNAGEDLKTGKNGLDASAWAAERKGKVVVVCLNPFLLDKQLAWAGLQHMIAVLQSQSISLPLPRAVEEAVFALFHVDAATLAKRQTLASLLPFFEQTTLTYDASQPDPDRRFGWINADWAVQSRLCEELKRLIEDRISLVSPRMNVVRRGLQLLDHSMVVLTHVDLVDALLPSITFADFERVFNDLFIGRPERMVSQQTLARLFKIDVTVPFETAEDGGEKRKGVITGRLREDGAAQLVSYIQSVARWGLEADSSVTIGRLSRERDTAAAERDTARRQLRGLESQTESLKTRVADLTADATRPAVDLAQQAVITGLQARVNELETADQRARDAVGELEKERSAFSRLKLERDQQQQALKALTGDATKDLSGLLETRDAENRQLREEAVSLKSSLEKLKEAGAAPVDDERIRKAAEAMAAGRPGDAETLRLEREKYDELRQRAHQEIGRRDALVEEVNAQLRTKDLQLNEAKNQLGKAERGGLGPNEAKDRDGYELSRLRPGKRWALFMLRSIPATPVFALLATTLLHAGFHGKEAETFGNRFVAASGAGLLVLSLSLLTGIFFVFAELGPRWIWFRSKNDKAQLFDVLTSAGERAQRSPKDFSVEVSPLLRLLGLGVVVREDNGLRYATSEPDAWVAHVDRSQVKRKYLLDVFTILVLLAWAAGCVMLMVEGK